MISRFFSTTYYIYIYHCIITAMPYALGMMHQLLDLGFLNMLNANTSLGLAVKCQSSCRHS